MEFFESFFDSHGFFDFAEGFFANDFFDEFDGDFFAFFEEFFKFADFVSREVFLFESLFEVFDGGFAHFRFAKQVFSCRENEADDFKGGFFANDFFKFFDIGFLHELAFH
jgi:hypothetical protein